jgi:hypothetical protein
MEVEKGGPERTRAEAGKAVNDMLLINALHFDKGDDGIVEVDDLEECALAAIHQSDGELRCSFRKEGGLGTSVLLLD